MQIEEICKIPDPMVRLLMLTNPNAKVGDLFKNKEIKPIDPKKYAYGWSNYAEVA